MPISAGGVGPGENITLEAMKEVAADTALELKAERADAKAAFMTNMQKTGNPFAAKADKSRKAKKARYEKVQKSALAGEKAKRMIPLKQIKDTASRYQQQNPELSGKMLLLLREYIKPGDEPEEMIKKVREFYDDVALADEALDFLEETTKGEVNEKIRQAKESLNQEFGREIRAGRNMGAIAREAADAGLEEGKPTKLRDLYRDITGNPREANVLFTELSQNRSYGELQKIIKFLMHSLGTDLKADGPSIPRGLLHRLMTESRTLQAILGVYRFFQGRESLMEKLFAQNQMGFPPGLDFEKMAKEFMQFVSDRYPSSEKALQMAPKLGVEKSLIGKIIALSQQRDAVKEVAVNRVFKSLQHRDDCYMALIEALEDLEDELEEREEEIPEIEIPPAA